MRIEVPGRLCLFGEHSDWAGGYRPSRPELSAGYCLTYGTDQGIAAVAERSDAVFEMTTPSAASAQVESTRERADAGALAGAARKGGFFSYALGAAAEVSARYPVGGIRIEVARADLPVGKGLSSSAAVCVLVVRAYAAVYGLRLSTREEMDLAYRGERLAGSECGRMDQICALGRRAALLEFDGEALRIDPVPLGATFPLLVVDLKRSKDTRRILSDLNRCFPDAPGPIASRVREALGPRNAEVVRSAGRALTEGDPVSFGSLMSEAQSIFDRLVAPACPELAAPRLHAVLEHPAVRDLAWGGKGVGSQGDGCAQLVARGPGERDVLARQLSDDLGVECLPLTLEPKEDDTVRRRPARIP